MLNPEQQQEISSLESLVESSTDFLEKMDLEDQLHQLKVRYGLIQQSVISDSDYECLGCGS